MSPKVRLFLIGSIVALVSFLLLFSLFGGIGKLQRMHQANIVDQKNHQYLLLKQKEEEKKKQEQALLQEPAVLSTETAQSGIQSTELVSGQNPQKISQQEVTAAVVLSPVSSAVPVKPPVVVPKTEPVKTITVQQLVDKYQNILDLNSDPEWKTYPLELRKQAYLIMNQKRAEQKTQTSKPANTGIDAIFIDGANAVKK